jgi:hypothetical protein
VNFMDFIEDGSSYEIIYRTALFKNICGNVGIELFNTLPDTIKGLGKIQEFKSVLKNFLLQHICMNVCVYVYMYVCPFRIHS